MTVFHLSYYLCHIWCFIYRLILSSGAFQCCVFLLRFPNSDVVNVSEFRLGSPKLETSGAAYVKKTHPDM
jgi:hypothetical protein